MYDEESIYFCEFSHTCFSKSSYLKLGINQGIETLVEFS